VSIGGALDPPELVGLVEIPQARRSGSRGSVKMIGRMISSFRDENFALRG
jgi:hypothetical protein